MSNTPGPAPVTVWIKSTYSGGEGGQCIEWAPTAAAATGEVPVRDSKCPHGPALAFPTSSWSSFVTSVKDGVLPTTV
ncbi:hypothetical protein SSP35_19_01330 [Streptomyces sp. NBRC 110611]|uniref:DUF397 domain-containing protein n=1 Tax=Streptomyces sp. NBRC 110611 TaxID=1621259 RepID=UPI0008302FE0|nr:DUF397 domain-containing protein [Streptomyces sp. NBRC 110611]GAU70495.1 hypothetical protein SSP35_19_01330 [Streptomyces sp. NBRC 110611]